MRWIVVVLVVVAVFGVAAQDDQLPEITAIAWSPSGLYLAIGYGDYMQDRCVSTEVRIYRDETLYSNLNDVGTCGVTGMGFGSNDDDLITQAASIRFWNLSTSQEIRIMRTPYFVNKLEISNSRTHLASVGEQRWVDVLDFVTTEAEYPVSLFEKDQTSITDIAWRPDDIVVAVASLDGPVGLWSPVTGELQQQLRFSTGIGKTAVSWSPHSRYIALGDVSGVILIVDTHVTELALGFSAHEAVIFDLDWSPDGAMLASASEDGTVRVWDAQTGDLIETYTYTGAVYALDWSPDGTKLAFGGADDSGAMPEVVIVDAPVLGDRPSPLTPLPTCGARFARQGEGDNADN